MRFEVKILDKEILGLKVKEMLRCRELNINKFIIESEVVYEDTYDFMFKVIDIKIIKHSDGLFIVNSVDGERWIEPLLIQVSDTGTLLDYFFIEFINTTDLDLTEYYINYLDFSEIMEWVRSKIGQEESI